MMGRSPPSPPVRSFWLTETATCDLCDKVGAVGEWREGVLLCGPCATAVTGRYAMAPPKGGTKRPNPVDALRIQYD